MLIPSCRITTEDLHVWHDRARADAVYASLVFVPNAIRLFDGGCIHSIRPMLCRRFMGKDSWSSRTWPCGFGGFRVVVPIVWVRVEPINPDCIAVRDEFFSTV